MNVGWRLGWADLRDRASIGVALGLMIAAPTAATLVLDGYRRTIDDASVRELQPRLVVQATNTAGEIFGSRVPITVADQLRELGVSDVIAEVHAITGERIDRAVLLRGVDVDRYRDVDSFEVVAGRALEPADPLRSVLVGEDLAQRRDVAPGSRLKVRGRDFTVVGIFRVGTFGDEEAWVPLPAAQEVLGWGTDVSVFVIPDEGVLRPGDHLPGGVSVAVRGDIEVFADEWLPLVDLVGFAARALEVGAAVVLAIALWRFAWLRRRELGILRLVGLPRSAVSAYLLAQGLTIAVVSTVAGITTALVLARLSATESLGRAFVSRIDPEVVARVGVTNSVVLGIGLAVPVVLLQRRRVTDLIDRSG